MDSIHVCEHCTCLNLQISLIPLPAAVYDVLEVARFHQRQLLFLLLHSLLPGPPLWAGDAPHRLTSYSCSSIGVTREGFSVRKTKTSRFSFLHNKIPPKENVNKARFHGELHTVFCLFHFNDTTCLFPPSQLILAIFIWRSIANNIYVLVMAVTFRNSPPLLLLK